MLRFKKIRKDYIDMNYSDYPFTLDIQIHQAQVSIPVTLNDTARKRYIGLTDGRKPYTIANGCRAVFAAYKPDGTTILNDCIIEGNTTIIYEFSQNTTSAEGIVNCEIRLYDASGKELTSPQFIIIVDKKVVRDEEVPISMDESTTISNMIIAEQGRIVAEAARVVAEGKRASAENERNAADIARDEAENARKATEEDRAEAEGLRAAAEIERVEAEIERYEAEQARVLAENERVIAEGERDEFIGELDSTVDELLKIQEDILDGRVEEIVPVAYPVGAIYLSVIDTAPAAIFGGTWERLKDRFLLGAGDTFSAGSVGGNTGTMLVKDNLPGETLVELKNTHWADITTYGAVQESQTVTAQYGAIAKVLRDQGQLSPNYGPFVQQEVATMPPYLAVHMWKRIA